MSDVDYDLENDEIVRREIEDVGRGFKRKPPKKKAKAAKKSTTLAVVPPTAIAQPRPEIIAWSTVPVMNDAITELDAYARIVIKVHAELHDTVGKGLVLARSPCRSRAHLRERVFKGAKSSG